MLTFFGNIISRAFDSNSNVIYLNDYKFERSKKYGNITYKNLAIQDWKLHQKWMREEAQRVLRRAHNERVRRAYGVAPGGA